MKRTTTSLIAAAMTTVIALGAAAPAIASDRTDRPTRADKDERSRASERNGGGSGESRKFNLLRARLGERLARERHGLGTASGKVKAAKDALGRERTRQMRASITEDGEVLNGYVERMSKAKTADEVRALSREVRNNFAWQNYFALNFLPDVLSLQSDAGEDGYAEAIDSLNARINEGEQSGEIPPEDATGLRSRLNDASRANANLPTSIVQALDAISSTRSLSGGNGRKDNGYWRAYAATRKATALRNRIVSHLASVKSQLDYYSSADTEPVV